MGRCVQRQHDNLRGSCSRPSESGGAVGVERMAGWIGAVGSRVD